MIKRILVPLDGSSFTEASMVCACDVAVRHKAELSCLTIRDPQSIERREATVMSRRGIERVAEGIGSDDTEAADRLTLMEFEFQDLCKKRGIPYTVLEDRGVPAESVVKMAYYYDLVVMGQHSFFHFETSDREDDTLRDVLAHSVTPVLCVPNKGPTGFDHACVIIDDSPEAARAVRQFARLAQQFHPRITLVGSMNDDDSMTILTRAAIYLKAHGFTDIADPVLLSDPLKGVSEDWFDTLGIVVTGRHSSHRWHELFHGSQAAEIVKHAQTSVFIGL